MVRSGGTTGIKIQANSSLLRVSTRVDSSGPGQYRGDPTVSLGRRYGREVGKRIMVAVVGAGIGSLAGLLVSFLGAGNWALIGGAAVGAVIPLVVLGPPSQPLR